MDYKYDDVFCRVDFVKEMKCSVYLNGVFVLRLDCVKIMFWSYLLLCVSYS